MRTTIVISAMGGAALSCCLGCGGTDASIRQLAPGSAGARGVPEATGTPEAGASPLARDAGSPKGLLPAAAGEGEYCADGHIGFAQARPFSHCDPSTSGGVECMVQGPCPLEGADSGSGGICAGVDTSSDPSNCGTCGTACAPVALVSGQARPGAITLDATSIYWATYGISSGTVMKAPRGGGAPTTLASGQKQPSAIAVDATSVYWATYDVGIGSGAVMKVPHDGGAPFRLATSPNPPTGIAVDATSVYFSQESTASGDGTVTRVPLGGGTPVTLAAGQNAASVAVDRTHVYWTTYFGAVMKIPLGGGTPTTLASSRNASSIAVDATNVYWTIGSDDGYYDGTVMSVPLGGGTPTTLASRQARPSAIAVDATSVYWTNLGAIWGPLGFEGSVMKVPLDGGTVTTLASNQTYPYAVATDATSAYWTIEDDPGTVLRVDKEPCRSGVCK